MSVELIEPVHPQLYVLYKSSSTDSNPSSTTAAINSTLTSCCPPSSTFPLIDIVVFLNGYGCQASVIASRLEALANAVPLAPGEPKPHREPMDQWVTFFLDEKDGDVQAASERLYKMLTALLPTSLPFQFSGTPSTFNVSVLDRMAQAHDAQIIYNPHQQWIRMPDSDKSFSNYIEPAALKLFATSTASSPTASSTPPPTHEPSSDSAALSPSSSDETVKPIVTVEPLRLEHVDLIMKWWPYTGPTTPKVLPYLIQHLPNRCVYVDGHPVSWALVQTYGGIGMLHTLHEHRGRGYARLCIDSLCQALYALNQTPFCYIGTANLGSQKVFSSLGFKPSHYCDWGLYVPNRLDPQLATKAH